jgi:hypothetical protein
MAGVLDGLQIAHLNLFTVGFRLNNVKHGRSMSTAVSSPEGTDSWNAIGRDRGNVGRRFASGPTIVREVSYPMFAPS